MTGRRVLQLREILGAGPGKPIPREIIAAQWQALGRGKGLSVSTLKRAETQDGGLTATVANLLEEFSAYKSVIVEARWLLRGQGIAPRMAQKLPIPSVGPQEGLAGSTTGPRSLLDRWELAELARKIGETLEKTLKQNEYGVRSSLEAQHAVIWALKDLSRRLKAMGFDMSEMFDLTDEMAAAVGLPNRGEADD